MTAERIYSGDSGANWSKWEGLSFPRPLVYMRYRPPDFKSMGAVTSNKYESDLRLRKAKQLVAVACGIGAARTGGALMRTHKTINVRR